MMEGLAERDDRMDEIKFDSKQRTDMEAYLNHTKAT